MPARHQPRHLRAAPRLRSLITPVRLVSSGSGLTHVPFTRSSSGLYFCGEERWAYDDAGPPADLANGPWRVGDSDGAEGFSDLVSRYEPGLVRWLEVHRGRGEPAHDSLAELEVQRAGQPDAGVAAGPASRRRIRGGSGQDGAAARAPQSGGALAASIGLADSRRRDKG